VSQPSPDLKTLFFSNSNEIDDFFKKYNEGGFVSWFNSNNSKFIKKGRSLNAIDDRSNWIKFWNQIPTLFGKDKINLPEFLTLSNIVSVETGSAFFPKTERVGYSGHPGIAYAFDRISGLKASYNTLSGNISAFDLFNDSNYINAHGNKVLGSTLRNTTDSRWSSESMPTGFSGNVTKETSSGGKTNGFLFEADFMKFRGRGFVQSTGRSKYKKLVDFVKKYKGGNTIINNYKKKWGSTTTDKVLTISSNDDWDTLFQDTDLIVPSYALFIFHSERTVPNGTPLYYINIRDDKTISDDTYNAGWQTNGAESYGKDISKIVNIQLSELAIIPDEPDPSANPPQANNSGGNNSGSSSSSSEPTTNYPDDLPRVEGLNNFFRPNIKLDPIKFDAPADGNTQKEVSGKIGHQPFVWYLSYQLKHIKSLILSSRGLVPTVKIVFTDTQNLMSSKGMPLDDSKITIFLNSRTKSLRPIFMEFKIANFSKNGDTYTIDGICNVNKFFLREFESYPNMSSFSCMKEFARKADLGFNSNVDGSDDIMNWINPGIKGSKFIKDVISSSYRSDESFIWCYVDFYYNLNYIDVEEALKIDISEQSGIKNSGLENLNGLTNEPESTTPLWLSNDASLDQTNQYFEDYKVINNSTNISLNNGYLTKSKFYDINDKNYLIFDIDSITSEGDKTIIMKGSPKDMQFFDNHIKPVYVGKLDTDNMHQNFNYSIVQNKQNITDLQKIGLSIKLKNPNYNLYRYQKVSVTISSEVSTPQKSQINERLSGEWLIIDIDFVNINGEVSQKVNLVKRELELSPQELENENLGNDNKGNQGENTTNDGDGEEEIDTSGDEIEVALDNELIPFSYDLEFTNSPEIDDFFDQYHTDGFVGWFNKEFGNDPDFTNNVITVVSVGNSGLGENVIPNSDGEVNDPIDKSNWTRVWNTSLSRVFNDNRDEWVDMIKDDGVKTSFNVIEFLTMNTMIYLLNGDGFKVKSDSRDLVDIFKSNNNLEGNETTLDLFNNDHYIESNGNKKFAPILSGSTSSTWSSNVFPVGFSGATSSEAVKKETSKENNEFITNADFYKFRERGLVKFRGRHDYGTLIKAIKGYNIGSDQKTIIEYKNKWESIQDIDSILNKTSDKDWDKLMFETDLIIPTLSIGNVMFDLKSVHIIPTKGKNESKIFKSIENVGKLVESSLESPGSNFVDNFVKMVKKQISFLNEKELVPAKEGSVQQPGEFDLDLIPGEYLDNDKNVINLAQIDGQAVRVDVANAYLTMREAAKEDGITLKINSAFRPPYPSTNGNDALYKGTKRYGINTKSESGVRVKASSQKWLYDGKNTGFPEIGRPKSSFNLAARPGGSRHGDGIGFDLNTGGSSGSRKSGVNRERYEWLVKNSWRFGFVRAVKSEEWHYDYRPHLIEKKGKGPYSDIDGTDRNKFYSDWGLDTLT